MKYSRESGWTGGDARTLYLITDTRTGVSVVRPGDCLQGIGPAVDIVIARRCDAEVLWQSPLHSGWTVVEPARPVPVDIAWVDDNDGRGPCKLSNSIRCF